MSDSQLSDICFDPFFRRPLCYWTFLQIRDFTAPLYFLITGIVQINGCSADYRIPIWMIVFGSLMLVDRILYLLFEYFLPRDENGVVIRTKKVELISYGYLICIVALSIIGLIWTSQVLQSSTIDSCNRFVFWPSFVLSILCVISLSLALFCIGLFWIGGCLKVSVPQNEDGGEGLM